jgi:uroporphyrin-3 C-methyltransferase
MSEQESKTDSPDETDPSAAPAAPDTVAAEPADEPAAEHATHDRNAPTWPMALAAMAATIALLALLASGFLWWQYRQFYLALNQVDAETAVALQRLRADERGALEQLRAIDEAVAAGRSRDDALSARLDALPGRLTDIERSISAVQGVSFDARQQWLRAEAGYYLGVANSELALAGRWDTAIAALELADGRLRELGNPALNPVRERIADELLALRAVRLPDAQGLNYSLARLAARIPELPLRDAVPAAYSGAGPAPDAEPGLARLWASIKAALATLISVQRQDAPVERALSAADRMLIQRQLGVELQLARAALLMADTDSFRQSLGVASDLLQRHFDGSSAAVESALALLGGMRELDIAPARPDISGSLNLLRSLPAGDA